MRSGITGISLRLRLKRVRAGGLDNPHGTFTRRDRFRDPTTRQVSQKLPAIGKTIVRTPEGLRFTPKSRIASRWLQDGAYATGRV